MATLLWGGWTSAMAQSADMAITKVGPANVTTGTNATYTITIINNGPNTASSVSVVDTVPPGTSFVSAVPQTNPDGFSCGFLAGTLTCSASTVANGGVDTLVLVLLFGAGLPDGTTVSNTATVTSSTPDGNGGNNTATAISTARAPTADLAITKVGPASVAAGSNATYTITVMNGGPNAAQNVTVTDVLPPLTTFVSAAPATNPDGFSCGQAAGTITCTAASFAPLSSDTLVVVLLISSSALNGAGFSNVATISSSTHDPVSGNNTATASSTVVNLPADVSITKVGPASVTAGTNATYTITITNGGPNDALNVMFSDTVPPGMTLINVTSQPPFNCNSINPTTISCTAPTMPNGTSDPFVVVMKAASGLPNGTVITNTATVSTTSTDATTADNTASATSTITNSADVSITKTGPATIAAGQNLIYTIVVANNGPSDAAGVVVSDPTPPGVTFVSNSGGCATAFPCNLGTLTSGQSVTITTTYTTSAATANGTVISNTATASSTTPDPTPGNNTSTSTTTVAVSADLSILKTGPTTITFGTNTSYQIVVSNAGPSNAANVVVTDAIPANASFFSVTTSQGSCSGTTTVTCNLGTVSVGGSATISLVVRVNSGASVSNTATVTSSTADPNQANNTSTTSTVPVTPISSTLVLTLIGFGLLALYQMRRRRARAA